MSVAHESNLGLDELDNQQTDHGESPDHVGSNPGTSCLREEGESDEQFQERMVILTYIF